MLLTITRCHKAKYAIYKSESVNTQFPRRRIGISMLLLFLVLIFLVQNAAPVDIQFLRWYVEMRRSVLIATVLVVGFVLGWSTRIVYQHMTGSDSSD